MSDLAFPEGSFQVVTSSLAIHNLPSTELRPRAVDEAVRVLAPGGRLVIADTRGTRSYADRLRAANLSEVEVRRPGPKGWFGGPWQAIGVVTATKA